MINGHCEVTLAEMFPFGQESNRDILVPDYEKTDIALQSHIKLFGRTLATISIHEDGYLATNINGLNVHCGESVNRTQKVPNCSTLGRCQ